MYWKRTVIGVLLKYCGLNHKAAKKERKKQMGRKGCLIQSNVLQENL